MQHTWKRCQWLHLCSSFACATVPIISSIHTSFVLSKAMTVVLWQHFTSYPMYEWGYVSTYVHTYVIKWTAHTHHEMFKSWSQIKRDTLPHNTCTHAYGGVNMRNRKYKRDRSREVILSQRAHDFCNLKCIRHQIAYRLLVSAHNF